MTSQPTIKQLRADEQLQVSVIQMKVTDWMVRTLIQPEPSRSGYGMTGGAADSALAVVDPIRPVGADYLLVCAVFDYLDIHG